MEYGDAVTVLRRMPLFASLDPGQLKLLAFTCDYLSFEDGEALFHAGDPADSAYVIDEGEAVIRADTDNGEVTVGTLGKHEMFGELAIFRNASRIATIRAHGRLKVLRIAGDIFLKLVTQNPDAALGVMRALSDKIARAQDSFEAMEAELRRLQAARDGGGGAQ